MPNWCSNGLTLTHSDPVMIDRVIKGKEGLLQEFIPCPQALIDTVSGFVGEGQAELEAQQASNVAKYGYATWYDHNVNEWGTKWDVSADSIERLDENTVSMSFDSAWAPPVAAYERLEALGFTVEAFYYEPGMQFVGKYSEGYDDCYEYGGQTSDTVRDYIGEELDDYFGISEEIAQYEDEENEDDEENVDIELNGGIDSINE
jgi:hypothetical protein